MSNDKLIPPTNIAESALFYSAGDMSLVIRVFAQVLGDLSPLPFPAVRGQFLSLWLVSVLMLRQGWMGTFTALPAGAVA